MFKSDLFNECSLSRHLEAQIAHALKIEEDRVISASTKGTKSVNWRIRETSLTDYIILSFVSLQSPRVRVEITDEQKTGSDIDLYIYKPWGPEAYSIQAKRALPKVDKTLIVNNGVYQQIGHKVKKKPQYDLLCAHALKLQSKPLYLFYHSMNVISACVKSAHGKMSSSLCGASVVDGAIVKNYYDKGVAKRREVLTYLSEMRRFSSLFCPIFPPGASFGTSGPSGPSTKPGSEADDRSLRVLGVPPPEEPPLEIDDWRRRSRDLGCSVQIVVDQRE